MRMTSKGQVTIPIEIREQLGLLPDTEVEFELKGEGVLIRKAQQQKHRGSSIVRHLRGRGTVSLTTNEILALTRGEP